MRTPKKQKIREKGNKVAGIILGGVLLTVGSFLLFSNLDKKTTNELADATLENLRMQCENYDNVLAASRTKSLFRITDKVVELARDQKRDPSRVNETDIRQYISDQRMTGLIVTDEALHTVISCSMDGSDPEVFQEILESEELKEVLNYPQKVMMKRVDYEGKYYDVGVTARMDQPGVLLGYTVQDSAVISGEEEDLATLLSGIRVDRGGEYLIVKNRKVIASNQHAMIGKEESTSTLLKCLKDLPTGEKMKSFAVGSSGYYGIKGLCQDYTIYLYYSHGYVYSSSLAAILIFACAYVLFWCVYYIAKTRVIHKNEKELMQTNQSLMETINILHAMQNVYFTSFYVDLPTDRYESVFLAPWLTGMVPEKGAFSVLVQTLIDGAVVEKYRPELRKMLSPEHIQDALQRKNLSEVRHSYYVDYQSIRNGEKAWCRVTVILVDMDKTGSPRHVLCVLQDVGEEKEKEAKYQEQILEEAQRARSANEAKTEFLRRISHDIRTPINGIQGMVKMAEHFSEDPEKRASCREKILASSGFLLDLVNDVLDMSKLETNEIILEEQAFSLKELVGEVRFLLENQATERGIRYVSDRSELPEDLMVVGSPLHLRQILLNIGGNAVKYGKEGGYIHTKVQVFPETNQELCREVEEKAENLCEMPDSQKLKETMDSRTEKARKMVHCRFICEDNGVGMSEEFQKHMFEPFMQEEQDARTTYKGTGLGLAIVQKLLEKMGGTIEVSSQKHIGTTIQIDLLLPVAEKAAMLPEITTTETEPVHLEGRQILLVEDNEINMEIAEFILEEYGMRVRKAWNGREAVEVFEKSAPGEIDAILMDIMMPVMNGLDATKAIRNLEREDAKNIPIIAMTANAFKDDIRRNREAGMNAHLSKPVDEQKLMKVLGRYLQD